MTRNAVTLLTVLLLAAATPAMATVTLNPSNGHFYEFVSSSSTWSAANTAATGSSYSGYQGHLVTITSSEEQSFVNSIIPSGAYAIAWIGGRQTPGSPEPGGGWTWVSGEPWGFDNWKTGEPNNGNGGGEDYIHLYTNNSITTKGKWNDEKGTAAMPYIVEYDGPQTPAFEIMYVYPEDQGYQWNGDEVRIHARVKSNWGSGNLQIRGGCTYFLESQMWLLDTQCFNLSAGAQYEAVFVTQTPPCPCEAFHCAKDIDISIRLEDASSNLLARVVDEDEFTVTSLTDEQITYYEQNINECWFDPGMRCWAQVTGVIPYFGYIPSLELFVDDMCRAGLMDRNGNTSGSGTAAFSAYAGAGFSIIELALDGGRSALERLAKEVFPWIEIAVVGLETRFECVRDFLHTLIYGAPGQPSKAISGAAAVDSLAYWFRAGLDSTGVDIADMLFVNGMSEIVVEADSSWARADSTGLMGVRMDAISDALSMTTVASDVRRVMSLSGVNLNNEACFTLRSQLDQDISMGLLHRAGNHESVYYRWPNLSMRAGAVVALRVASDLTALYVKIDDNEDGRFDRWVYAEGTGVTGVPPVVAPQLHQNQPNPFNPSTMIAYYLPVDGPVSLTVYDIRGRLVRHLGESGNQVAGKHEVTWDGLSDDGAAQPSGVYFCRLEAGSYVQAIKLALLK